MPSPKITRREPYHGTQAVARAISILKVFENSPATLTAVQIAAQLKLNRSTVHRLLSILETEGFVARESSSSDDARHSAYRLGPALISLGGIALRQINIRSIALPHLRSLAQLSGETVDLEILIGREVMIIEEVQGEHVLRVGVGDNIGGRYPAHTTSTGKILLAALNDDDLKEFLAFKLNALTPNTFIDKQLLREQLDLIRKQGWASAWEELEIGLMAVGAPIRDWDGQVIASVSVSGPTVRINKSRIRELAPLVIDCAKNISRDLGFMRR
jgi:IclR family transcriptional regulator, acetate operon repressor